MVGDAVRTDLAEAVASLRDELLDAVAQRPAEAGVSFEVGAIEMEFAVESRKDVGGKGGIRFWVVNAEASAQRSTAAQHRVRVTLTPRSANGQPLLISTRADDTSRPPRTPIGR